MSESIFLFKVITAYKSIGDLDLTIKENEMLISFASPGGRDEWLYVIKAKDTKQQGYVPAALIDRVGDSSEVNKYKKKIDKYKSTFNFDIPLIREIISTRGVNVVKQMQNSNENKSKNDPYQKKATEQWKKAVDLFNQGNFRDSIESFKSVGRGSRVLFNIAICYISLQETRNAIFYLTEAIHSDKYFAVAYLLRGNTYFKCQDYFQAVIDYSTTITLIRDNDYIDYQPMGINYIMYRSELYFNRGFSFHKLGLTPKAIDDLTFANRIKDQKDPKQTKPQIQIPKMGPPPTGNNQIPLPNMNPIQQPPKKQAESSDIPILFQTPDAVANSELKPVERTTSRPNFRPPMRGNAMSAMLIQSLPSDPREILRRNREAKLAKRGGKK
ncbi:sh3 domain-containing protein c23a1.17 [Anaeramoeba ignava]|uniref:Sh3 domain-containing protein c23a1.17 n=1 Tax=Anaeramoeba ignava TaxID=1746090 RepID=A0A9Q0LFM1_ANAIG|nr:sh3 domain-containing protein c23a1.17 [Anaeramoeba ignava]